MKKTFNLEKINNFVDEIKRDIDNTIVLIKTNFKPILWLILINLILAVYGTTFIIDNLFRIIYRIYNIRFLVSFNARELLLTPIGIAAYIFMGILVGMIVIFEMAALNQAFAMSQIGRETTIQKMVSYGLATCGKAAKPKNWIIFPFITVILPLSGIVQISNTTWAVLMPGFVKSFLLADPIYSKLLYIAYFLIVILIVCYLFSLNYFCISDYDFIDCCKNSRKLMTQKTVKSFFVLFVFYLLFILIVLCFSSSVSTILVQINARLHGKQMSMISEANKFASIFEDIRMILKGTVVPMVTLATLSTIFFAKVEETGDMTLLSSKPFQNLKVSLITKVLIIAFFLASIIYNVRGIYVYRNAIFGDSDYPMIVAHRGDSVNAPENTMPAFEMAAIENVEWVELDVHETKDGVIIVSHDDDLERVSGQDVCVHELTFEETQKLDVGSWFSENYKGTKLSKLEDVLKLFKEEDIYVQIEIKPTAYDFQIEEKVLEVVNSTGMHDQCTILSLNPEPLIRIKELDPTMSTTYCAVFAIDHIEDIKFADHLSVEESNIDPELVENVHSAGKMIFCWTVNSEASVQYLTYCNVDGILTDNPMMLDRALDEVDIKGGIIKALSLAIERLIRGY